MVSLEGEYAFGYTKLTGEFTRDTLETGTGHDDRQQWFIQGVQTLSPRWFVAARHEGANAPPRPSASRAPTLRMSEVTVGFRLSTDFTIRTAVVRRKTYFSPSPTSRSAPRSSGRDAGGEQAGARECGVGLGP